MNQPYRSLRNCVVSMLGSVAVAACSGSGMPAPQTNTGDVEAAYTALVGEAARCAKQVNDCLQTAAMDRSAIASCRDSFRMCRETSGQQKSQALANAVRACTQAHHSCVKSADGATADRCEPALNHCLTSDRKSAADSDDDAGVDDTDTDTDTDKHKRTARADCMDELRACVKADHEADACADAARNCVKDSLPTAAEVAPVDDDHKGRKDVDDTADESATGDAGVVTRSDKSPKTGDNAHDNAAQGTTTGMNTSTTGTHTSMSARASAARSCVRTFSSCVESASTARLCAQQLRACREKL